MKNSVNWFYIVIGLLFLSMLYISAKFFKGSGNSSVGIAQSKEYKINSEKSALVSKVFVVPGRQVKAGDPLIELTSQEMEIDIDKLSNRIVVLKSEQEEKSKLVESEISMVKAEYGIKIGELDSDLDQIASEVKLNKKLTSEFAASTDTTSSVDNPLRTKTTSLQQQKKKYQHAMDIRIEDIRQDSKTEQSQLVNQIRLLEREFALLQDEKKKLSKFAAADGVVENVYVKDGEQVDAFTSLLSVNPVRPTTVIAYLVGKKSDSFQIGATVNVTPYDRRVPGVTGKVIGYGSVSELPQILQKSTAVTAFGREVFIEITPENDFANGEKVLIR